MKLCIDCDWVTREQIATSYDASLKYRCRNEKCGIRQSPVDGSWDYADCEDSRNQKDEGWTTCGPDALYFKPRDREKESREHAERIEKLYDEMFPKTTTKTHWLWTWPKW